MEEKPKLPIDVYFYGMVVYSTINMLSSYPEPDTYGEILETHQVVGGEAGNGAIILSSLGCSTRLEGPFLGSGSRDGVLEFLGRFGIDCSGLEFDPTYDGVRDLVMIDRSSRTVFGRFGEYFSGPRRWSAPNRKAIELSRVVAVDPFFREESLEVSRICRELHKPYVTIDCPPDCEISRYSSAIAVSNEYMQNNFRGVPIPELFERYTEQSEGLVVFTFGGREILYGRKGQRINRLIPFRVEVKSTLGAGDVFRAGIAYGLLEGFDDEKTVRFAAALAAQVCTRFPFALDPPGKAEVLKLAGIE
jgi:sugar/nucleoside kinase (ribokinase family)